MKTVRMMTCVPGFLLVLSAPLPGAVTAYHEMNVATTVSPYTRTVNWGTRSQQTGGTWGVSSESYFGFRLTSLFDGVEGAQLSYEATLSRGLGVNAIGTAGRIVYRTNAPAGREGIRLDLPADGAPVGIIEGEERPFAGIRRIAFDRLNNGTGNIVTITGFVADPEASWAISPFATPPELTYNSGLGTLSFETLNATGWDYFGELQFANLNATLSETGVALVFSNDRANNNNSYALVGWQYAVIEEAPPTPLRVDITYMDGVSLSIDGPSGASYLIQTSTDLREWSNVATVTPAVVPFAWSDPAGPASNWQFYRVQSPPP